MADLTRYGVFLRPDPLTCAAVTRITDQLRAQYGLVSAGAFPPHATLAGSLPLGDRVEAFTGVLDDRLGTVAAFPVENAGIFESWGGLVFAIHERAGAPNAALVELAAAVDAAARPYLARVAPAQIPADVQPPRDWLGHVSLASHDLAERADLLDEVEAYVRALDVLYPATFTADTVAMYRFTHASWAGAWWREMQWEHVRSWRLRA